MREFRQKNTRSAERYWQVWLEDDYVCSTWGAIVAGKCKEHGRTRDRPGPKGKLGTKVYMDSTENAKFHMDRDIRKKSEGGYVEVNEDGAPLAERATTEVDFSSPLPKNLCFSKPRNKMSPEIIHRLEENGDLMFTRKVNGMAVIVQVCSNNAVHIYSRRMDPISGHFPHLHKAISELKVPPGSILMFEAFMGEGNSKQDLLLCSQVMRSKMVKALERQEELGWMKFYLYRIPFWKGQHLESMYTCGELADLIDNTLTDKFIDYRDSIETRAQGRFLFTLEQFQGSVEEAREMAEKYKYEGWVCYQKSAIMKDYSYSFDGKASRPACAFKMKLSQTDDFIAYWDPDNGTDDHPLGTWGTGKNMGKVGTLSLYQLNSRGEEVYIADTSGFTDEMRDYLGGLEPGSWPLCVEVKFDGRFYKSQGDKTNSLDFPRFQRIREMQDKKCEECVDENL